VLLIVLDTARADALGVSGSANAHTPHMDQLAREGVVFTHARSTSAWTVPAHGSLFTGLYPSNHGAHHEHPRLDSGQVTLAELLAGSHQNAGFSENSFLQRANGYAQGFGHFEEVWRERKNWREPPGTLEKIRRWLAERDREREFFVFVNLMTPHLPYDPPERYEKKFVPAEASKHLVRQMRTLGDQHAQLFMTGDLALSTQAFEVLRGLYLADVAYTDEQVGEIIAMLRSEGVLDETLVVVVGDHGENIGDHQLMEHQFSLNETLLRVPMIVRLPDAFPPGDRSDAPIQLVDLVPTVIDLIGVGRGHLDDLDGESLVGDGPPPTRPVLAEYMRPVMQRDVYKKVNPFFDFGRFDRRLKSLQIGRLKLIVSDHGQSELYDLKSDPGETTDLASERPEELAFLRDQLESWTGGSWKPGQRGSLRGIDEETERELRALGYIQ
jgi:arylsulfatase A-like enzyme